MCLILMFPVDKSLPLWDSESTPGCSSLDRVSETTSVYKDGVSSLLGQSQLPCCMSGSLQTLAECVFAQELLEFLLLWVTQMTGIQPYHNSCSVAFRICPLINWCMQETCSPSYSNSGYATLIRGPLLYQQSPTQIISATWLGLFWIEVKFLCIKKHCFKPVSPLNTNTDLRQI